MHPGGEKKRRMDGNNDDCTSGGGVVSQTPTCPTSSSSSGGVVVQEESVFVSHGTARERDSGNTNDGTGQHAVGADFIQDCEGGGSGNGKSVGSRLAAPNLLGRAEDSDETGGLEADEGGGSSAPIRLPHDFLREVWHDPRGRRRSADWGKTRNYAGGERETKGPDSVRGRETEPSGVEEISTEVGSIPRVLAPGSMLSRGIRPVEPARRSNSLHDGTTSSRYSHGRLGGGRRHPPPYGRNRSFRRSRRPQLNGFGASEEHLIRTMSAIVSGGSTNRGPFVPSTTNSVDKVPVDEIILISTDEGQKQEANNEEGGCLCSKKEEGATGEASSSPAPDDADVEGERGSFSVLSVIASSEAPEEDESSTIDERLLDCREKLFTEVPTRHGNTAHPTLTNNHGEAGASVTQPPQACTGTQKTSGSSEATTRNAGGNVALLSSYPRPQVQEVPPQDVNVAPNALHPLGPFHSREVLQYYQRRGKLTIDPDFLHPRRGGGRRLFTISMPPTAAVADESSDAERSSGYSRTSFAGGQEHEDSSATSRRTEASSGGRRTMTTKQFDDVEESTDVTKNSSSRENSEESELANMSIPKDGFNSPRGDASNITACATLSLDLSSRPSLSGDCAQVTRDTPSSYQSEGETKPSSMETGEDLHRMTSLPPSSDARAITDQGSARSVESPYIYPASAESKFSFYAVKVDPNQGDRACEIALYSLARPHMRAFHCAWLAFFVAFFTWFALAPLLSEVQATLGLTKEDIWTSSICGIAGTLVMRVAMGPFCDKFGARIGMTSILVVSAIPTALTGLVNTSVGLSVLRLFIGIAGSSFVACQYWTITMFTKEVAGTANALVSGWGNLGGGVTQLVMGSLLFPLFKLIFNGSEELAWRTVCIVPACISAMVAVAIFRNSDDSPKGNYQKRKKEGSMPTVSASASLEAAIRNLNSWILFIQYGCCFGVEITMTNAAALYFKEEFHQTTEAAAAIASVFGWMNLFARGLGGFASDMFNARFGMKGRIGWQFVSLLVQGIATVAFGASRSLPGAIIVMMFFSIFVQSAEGSTYGIVPYVNPRFTGAVAGVIGAGGNFGGVLFSTAFRQFDYRKAFTVMGLFAMASSTLSFFINIRGHSSFFHFEDTWACASSCVRPDRAVDPATNEGEVERGDMSLPKWRRACHSNNDVDKLDAEVGDALKVSV